MSESLVSEAWDEYVARVKALPPEEQRQALNQLGMVWDMDWDIILSPLAMLGHEVGTRAEYRAKNHDE